MRRSGAELPVGQARRKNNPHRRFGRNKLQIDHTKLLLTLAITAIGLAGRSGIDKLLALRGGGELVALWAQLSSVIEMIAGVALAGVGAGLSVLVAQTARPERQQLFLRRALFLGLTVSLPVAAVAAFAGLCFPAALGGDALSGSAVLLASAEIFRDDTR